jgi:hypothetical protein
VLRRLRRWTKAGLRVEVVEEYLGVVLEEFPVLTELAAGAALLPNNQTVAKARVASRFNKLFR